MSDLQNITKRLQDVIALEGKESLDQLGSYIVGILIIDEGGWKLYQSNERLARIAELGSDLEISNGNTTQLNAMWDEIKQITAELKLQTRS